MKKVLILAYDFPPLRSAGAARPYGWYLYMKKYGLEPVIVTRKWEESMQSEEDMMQDATSRTETEVTEFGTLIKVPYLPNARDRWAAGKQNPMKTIVRKLLSAWSVYAPFITFHGDASRNIYTEADRYLSANKVDLILATGGPFHLFRYAALLSAKHRIPWFADFRDLWSYYPNHGLGFMSEVVEKNIKRRFENRYLRTAQALVAVTPPMIDILQQAHQKKVFLSMNGYIDYSRRETGFPEGNRNELKIAYIGTLYDYYPMEDFFSGFKAYAKQAAAHTTLTFIGMDFYPQQKKKILSLTAEVSDHIRFTDKFSAEALQKELESYDVLLLFGKEEGLSIHIKLFEYLLLSKPILLFGKNNKIMGNIIEDTLSGYICETGSSLGNLLAALQLEKQSEGKLVRKPRNLEKYSRAFQAKKLVDFLLAEALE